MYPLAEVSEGLVNSPPKLHTYGDTFHTSVPSIPRPYWLFDLFVSLATSERNWVIVVGGPEIPAAAKSALFQNSTCVLVSSGSP
jgi:hypothetical protein